MLPEAVTDRDKKMTQSLMDQISCKSNARQNMEGEKIAFNFVTVTELGVEFFLINLNGKNAFECGKLIIARLMLRNLPSAHQILRHKFTGLTFRHQTFLLPRCFGIVFVFLDGECSGAVKMSKEM